MLLDKQIIAGESFTALLLMGTPSTALTVPLTQLRLDDALLHGGRAPSF